MPTANINGVNLNYRLAGAGEDLILIHGLAANHAFWNLMVLLPLVRQYRVTVYDLRGHGYSEMPPSGYTTADMAADLRGLMDYLEIERAHLVGHSFGGVAALHCTTLFPERVTSLTLADSRVRALQPHQRLRDWPDWRQAKAKLEEYGIEIDEDEDDIGVRLLEKLAAPEWRTTRRGLSKQGLFVPFSGWSQGNRSAERWLKLLDTTTARQDVKRSGDLTLDRIRAVQQPTLAIYGERSRCLKTSEELQRILNHCRTVIVRGVGHFYPVIKPLFMAQSLLDFLNRRPEQSVAPHASTDQKDLAAAAQAKQSGATDVSARRSPRRSSTLDESIGNRIRSSRATG